MSRLPAAAPWGTNARGMWRDSELQHNKERGQTSTAASQSYEFNIEQGLAIVGSPETVARELKKRHEWMGFNVFCTNHQIGKMPPPLVNKSIELFGKEVIPAFA